MNRKTAPGVRDGKVQKKNRQALSPDYYVEAPPELLFHRLRPGPGYRHVLNKQDVWEFMEIIPDWQKMSEGLRAIVLTPDDRCTFGLYNQSGIIKLGAWSSDFRIEIGKDYIRKFEDRLSMIGPIVEPTVTGIEVTLTEPQAKAFLLLGTFLHELGHHIDRMTTRSKRECSNGEPFAERFEAEWRRKLWAPYCRAFGL